MLDRALVKRLRDSDSESEKEEESSSSQSKKSSADKPTDILTTDKPTDILTTDKPTKAQVRVTTRIQQSIFPIRCLDWVQITCANVCLL